MYNQASDEYVNRLESNCSILCENVFLWVIHLRFDTVFPTHILESGTKNKQITLKNLFKSWGNPGYYGMDHLINRATTCIYLPK